MTKKHYDLMIDEESMTLLDGFLDAAGMTRSGFINTLVVKTVKAMKLKEAPDVRKMTLSQLFETFKGLQEMLSAEEKGRKKK